MKKILIANRGEIACRVIKTAKKMGIATVAIYSEADNDALHVRMADESYCVGPAASSKSYLVIDNILAAIKATKADGVHPGYGFLSENLEFCRALKKKRVKFIGPGPEAIKAMGDKIASKKLAKEAGVSTIPGFLGEITSEEQAKKIAREIGYPVMVKASAGGGGKGMRVARNDEEAVEAWRTAANEGRSYFNDDRVFMEKFIENPRHIEIQVIGDQHGKVLYLNERECSIQRRHQKVIEEAPSPFVDPKMRKAMGQQAVALAKAVKYHSAGTVEFIVGQDKSFYFLEMNTRLQVEHPITEMITGLDLVELMIKVADGEKLPMKQSDIGINGWAMESRIYAEDPYRNFMPSIGRLVHYQPPKETDFVRVDTGVYAGGEVSMHYDPMIAKLCVWGDDREDAIFEMRRALDNYFIEGPLHNIDLLATIMKHERFQRGELSTDFIADEFPDGFQGCPLTPADENLFAAAAATIEQAEMGLYREIPGSQKFMVTVDKEVVEVEIQKKRGLNLVTIDREHTMEVSHNYRLGARVADFSACGQTYSFQVKRLFDGYRLSCGGSRVVALVRTLRQHELGSMMPVKEKPDMAKFIMSPMPGLVLKVMVEPGDAVGAGQAVCVLEAMKMENIMRSEVDGIVKEVKAAEGLIVEVDEVLIELE